MNERVEQRAKELYACRMEIPDSAGDGIWQSERERVRVAWRRVARLTFRWEMSAVAFEMHQFADGILAGGDRTTIIKNVTADYAPLLPEDK